MAVKMRLRREGKKKQPYYRVVVADVRSPRDGRFIEDLGYYQPLAEPSSISIDRERALYWLRNGVKPSDAVVNLLRIEGIWDEFRPGDPGKERSVRNRARAAAVAEQKAGQKQTARGEPERPAAAPAEPAAPAPAPEGQAPAVAPPAEEAEPPPVAEADPSTVGQARDEDPQPDPEPIEDAGALKEDEQP